MRCDRLGCAPVLVVASACHERPPVSSPIRTTPSPPAAPARPPAPAPPPTPSRNASPGPLTEAELFQRKSLEELNAEHPLGDAFFDYDRTPCGGTRGVRS